MRRLNGIGLPTTSSTALTLNRGRDGLFNLIRNAPHTLRYEHQLAVALSAAVERVYPLDQFKEAFEQSLKPNRSGKILFKFGAH
jgi:hypothetical protein